MSHTDKKVPELKQLCKDYGLSATGTKPTLIDRIQQHEDKREAERNRFKVFIKTLMGSCYTIYLDRDSTITELKQKIEEKNGFPVEKQRLYYICNAKPKMGDISYPTTGQTGVRTENDKTLSDYNVYSESTFMLEISLR